MISFNKKNMHADNAATLSDKSDPVYSKTEQSARIDEDYKECLVSQIINECFIVEWHEVWRVLGGVRKGWAFCYHAKAKSEMGSNYGIHHGLQWGSNGGDGGK